MDVIINNAAPGTPVQVVPQQYVPQQYVPGPYPTAPYGYGPHGGPPGFLLVLLIVGAVIFLRRRRHTGWNRSGAGSSPGAAAEGSLGEEVRDTFRRGRARFLNDRALDIARERYAKGEINADEYETLKRTLTGGEPCPPADSGESTLNL